MIILKQNKTFLYVCTDNKILIYNHKNGSSNEISIPNPPTEPNQKQSLENRQILSASISENSELCMTFQNKQLVIYDCKFKIIKNMLTKRTASRVQFINDNDILVADKTGDVFLYKLKDECVEPELILGHLSMLLDITISECGKYVITSDRDEKIRVSCYPNCYNIVSFCLGHYEFVTNIVVCKGMLISASGDGTIRCWDFVCGKQVSIINTNEYIDDKSLVESFRKTMDSESIDVVALPIINMQIFQENVIVIGVTLLNFMGVQIYCVEKHSDGVSIQFLQNVMVNSKVVAFSLNRDLFILTDTEFLVYKMSENCYVKVTCESLNKFYDNSKNILLCSLSDSSVTSFYKRKYDNVQDYLQKKRLRIENKF